MVRQYHWAPLVYPLPSLLHLMTQLSMNISSMVLILLMTETTYIVLPHRPIIVFKHGCVIWMERVVGEISRFGLTASCEGKLTGQPTAHRWLCRLQHR